MSSTLLWKVPFEGIEYSVTSAGTYRRTVHHAPVGYERGRSKQVTEILLRSAAPGVAPRWCVFRLSVDIIAGRRHYEWRSGRELNAAEVHQYRANPSAFNPEIGPAHLSAQYPMALLAALKENTINE